MLAHLIKTFVSNVCVAGGSVLAEKLYQIKCCPTCLADSKFQVDSPVHFSNTDMFVPTQTIDLTCEKKKSPSQGMQRAKLVASLYFPGPSVN